MESGIGAQRGWSIRTHPRSPELGCRLQRSWFGVRGLASAGVTAGETLVPAGP